MIDLGIVWIVLLNYKNWDDTIECVESIKKSTYKNYSIVIVDNDSDGEYSKYIEENKSIFDDCTIIDFNGKWLIEKESKHSNITIILNKKNSGFSGGNNIALGYIKRQIEFDYVWFLNNDTVVYPKTMENFMLKAKEDKKDIIGTVVLDYYADDKIDHIGISWNMFTQRVKLIGKKVNINNINCIKTEDAKMVSGCSFVLSNTFIKKMNQFYDKYFLYGEELELYTFCKKNKFKPDICLNSFIKHKGAASSGKGHSTPIKDYYVLRAKIIYCRRYMIMGLIPIIIIEFGLRFFIRVLQLKWEYFPFLLSSLKDGLNDEI